jgi:hypothetical protein
MLKKIRQAGEAVGIINVSLPDATEAAEQRRAELVASQAAIADAERELDRLHDAGASPRDMSAAEAHVADAKLTAERAQRAFQAAERRLAQARDAEGAEHKAEAVKIRDVALEAQREAAAEIDRLAALMAIAVKLYEAQFNALSEAASAGVAARALHVGGAEIVRHALERAGAMPSSWLGPRSEQPGAVAIAEKQRGAILAV